MTDKHLNPKLHPGAVIHTMTLGRVRIKEFVNDEVHCQVVGGKAQIILSRKAAMRRILNREKVKL